MIKHISLTCKQCSVYFNRNKSEHNYSVRKKKLKNTFCSIKCERQYRSDKTRTIVKCANCQKEMSRPTKHISDSLSGSVFCSRSCAATYNNTHKTHGTRRSKLEKWLEEQLSKLYSFEIHFNRKDAINSELDIYIPGLKLAFELNGIYHYEPIHGPEKLSSVQNNDNRKFQACLENGVELCIIDTSKFGYFKESGAKVFLDIIEEIINIKMS